jgi:hypothetical protein
LSSPGPHGMITELLARQGGRTHAPLQAAHIFRKGTFMITTITTITTAVADPAQAGTLAAIAIVTLLGLLVQREILGGSAGSGCAGLTARSMWPCCRWQSGFSPLR